MRPTEYIRPIKIIICCTAILLTGRNASAIGPDQIRFHNETSDTVRITEILTEVLSNDPGNPGQRMEIIGRKFLDTPYVAHTLESEPGQPEMLTVNVDELDCTTFVETVAAMAMTVGEGRSSWRDFVHNLERIRYRGGNINGYSSRLHYIADWIVDNSYRGNLKDAAPSFPRPSYITKTINFMTANRDRYPALTDSVQFDKVRSIEDGYRNHRFPYIKTIDLGRKETKAAFRTGDIVALTTNLKNLDVTHLGIVVLIKGEPFLMHASSSLGKVVITTVPLDEFMRRNRSLTGVRVFRLTE